MFKSLNFKVILFGFIFTFFSSFGQSFFLGLFNSSIRDALSITHGQFGSIYASATLLSSFLLIWVGKKIDDIDILKFSFFEGKCIFSEPLFSSDYSTFETDEENIKILANQNKGKKQIEIHSYLLEHQLFHQIVNRNSDCLSHNRYTRVF